MSIEIRNLNKSFGKTVVCDNLNLDIPSGELVALLGPSGSGKTSLLRIIAGLERPDSGTVLFHGEDATFADVRQRNVGFVFQHYALFGHMTIFENVAFGLRVRPRRVRLSEDAIRTKVNALLALVQLDWLADRFPHQLSGGQRQRIALARALAVEPRVLLLDEPFGALDARVRQELRRWLRRLHDEVHVTSVFVTHDQEEALEMSNRLAVMDGGRIMQLGTPEEVYREPLTEFVADFLGVANLLDVECVSATGAVRTVRFGEFDLEAQAPASHDAGPGRAVIRPECVEVAEAGLTGANRLPGMVDRTVFLGSTTQVMVRLPQGAVLQSLITNTKATETFSAGQPVTVCLPPESLRVLATSSEPHAMAYAETS
jgi:sulfate ABC transporter ATP-binding protein